jgi:hypothetical protein
MGTSLSLTMFGYWHVRNNRELLDRMAEALPQPPVGLLIDGVRAKHAALLSAPRGRPVPTG